MNANRKTSWNEKRFTFVYPKQWLFYAQMEFFRQQSKELSAPMSTYLNLWIEFTKPAAVLNSWSPNFQYVNTHQLSTSLKVLFSFSTDEVWDGLVLIYNKFQMEKHIKFIPGLVQNSKESFHWLGWTLDWTQNGYFCLNKQETYGRQLILFLLFVQLTASWESLHLLLLYRLGMRLNSLQITHPSLFNSWRQTE